MKTDKVTVKAIVALKSGSNSKGPWTLWKFLIDGGDEHGFTTFESYFKVGGTYSIRYEEEVNGQFINRKVVPNKVSQQKQQTIDIVERINKLEKRVEELEQQLVITDDDK